MDSDSSQCSDCPYKPSNVFEQEAHDYRYTDVQSLYWKSAARPKTLNLLALLFKQYSCRISPEAFHLAIGIADSYMSSKWPSRVLSDVELCLYVHLIGLASLSITAKFCNGVERFLDRAIKDHFTPVSIKLGDLQRAEVDILTHLHWDLRRCTIFTFMDEFKTLAFADQKGVMSPAQLAHLTDYSHRRLNILAGKLISDSCLMPTPVSYIFCGLISCERRYFNVHPFWPKHLEDLSGYDCTKIFMHHAYLWKHLYPMGDSSSFVPNVPEDLTRSSQPKLPVENSPDSVMSKFVRFSAE